MRAAATPGELVIADLVAILPPVTHGLITRCLRFPRIRYHGLPLHSACKWRRLPPLDALRTELSHDFAQDLDGASALQLQTGEFAFQVGTPHLFTSTFERGEV